MTEIRLPAAEDTLRLGAALAERLAAGDALLLFGALGAGKTTLARGLVSAWLGQDEETPSPTYTLAQIYEGGRVPLWHFDLYRLKDPSEIEEIGLWDALAEGVALIEWPERLGPLVPKNRIELRLRVDGEGRIANMAGFGRLLGARI